MDEKWMGNKSNSEKDARTRNRHKILFVVRAPWWREARCYTKSDKSPRSGFSLPAFITTKPYLYTDDKLKFDNRDRLSDGTLSMRKYWWHQMVMLRSSEGGDIVSLLSYLMIMSPLHYVHYIWRPTSSIVVDHDDGGIIPGLSPEMSDIYIFKIGTLRGFLAISMVIRPLRDFGYNIVVWESYARIPNGGED